jgi:hypothetical protein
VSDRGNDLQAIRREADGPAAATASPPLRRSRGVKMATDLDGTLADVVAVGVDDGGGAVP